MELKKIHHCISQIHSPVVKAGVHSCSPVAPQSKIFDGVVVAEVAKEEFITEVFRFCALLTVK